MKSLKELDEQIDRSKSIEEVGALLKVRDKIFPYPKPERSPRKPKTPIKKVNRKRKARLFKEDYGGSEYHAFIHSLPCAICEAPCEYTEAAHVRSRGAGGKASDIVPLCGGRRGTFGCHYFFDTGNPTERSHKMRLRSLAKKLYSGWLASQSTGSKRGDK